MSAPRRSYTRAELAQAEPLVREAAWDHPQQLAIPAPLAVVVELPLRLVSEANAHEHWRERQRRAKTQRANVDLFLRLRAPRGMAGALARAPGASAVVTMTRIAPRPLDSDNAVGACKHVRDAVAAFLGIDDRSDRVAWTVEQEKGKPKTYGVRIAIEIRL